MLDNVIELIGIQANRRSDLIGRLLSNCTIDPITNCWNWDGATSGSGRGGGYGRISVDGQTVATHLVSFVHFKGFIPGKKQVDHTCENRLCFNPNHLELVSHKQNQQRKIKR